MMSAEQKSDEFSGEVDVNDASTSVRKPPLPGPEILLRPPINEFLKRQSVPLKDDPTARRSPRVKEGELFGTLFEGVYTVHDMFMHGYRIDHGANCAGWRPKPDGDFSWITYQNVYEKVCTVGSGLISKGARPNQEQLIGIYSKNSIAWMVMDRICAAYSMVSVPLYDSLGPEALTHIVKQCELQIVLVDTNDHAQKLLVDSKSGKTKTLKMLILVEEPVEKTTQLSTDTSVEVITFDKLEELGKGGLCEFVPPASDDVYTICYTSGTTGTPKGVVHSHKNGVALTCAFLINAQDYYYKLNPADVLFSYLPLAHVFERYIESGVLMHGGGIGFYGGDPKLLLDDAKSLKPTIFPMVPRLLNKIHTKIMTAVGNSGPKRWAFDFCLARKMAALKRGEVHNDTFWDKMLFHKFQAAVGGRVKFSITAAAPVSASVLNVVRCVLGIPILEGYGQTESTSGFTTTLYGDFAGGNVGSILPNMYVKLVDVPEKEYYTKNNQGEVCCKGLSVFKEYYKDEEKTKEAFDEDGWLRTGDIGEWLPNGSLKIIDRRKNIFKLSQGEYIAPEKIEQIYSMNGVVNQVFVYGKSIKSSIVGIVVPEEETINNWCKENGIATNGKSFEEVCNMEAVGKAILEDINKTGKQQGLKGFELVRKVFISSEAFSVENGLLTPTLKCRRPQVEKRYRSEIDEMYTDLE